MHRVNQICSFRCDDSIVLKKIFPLVRFSTSVENVIFSGFQILFIRFGNRMNLTLIGDLLLVQNATHVICFLFVIICKFFRFEIPVMDNFIGWFLWAYLM